MGARLYPVPPTPGNTTTLDQAWQRAYVELRAQLLRHIDECTYLIGAELGVLRGVEQRLTTDLVKAGCSGTLAYQLARPPVGA